MLRAQRTYVGARGVELSTTDDSGAPITPTSVTVAGSTEDGTVTTLSNVIIDAGGIGKHSAVLTCPRPTIVDLVWSWSVGTDTFTLNDQVVFYSRPILTPDELRGNEPSLQSEPGDALALAIEDAERECEEITGRSFSSRYSRTSAMVRDGIVDLDIYAVSRVGRCTLDGSDHPLTLIPRTTLARCPVPDGSVIVVGVEHGEVEAPLDIRYAIAWRARQAVQRPKGAMSLYTDRVTVGPNGETVRRMLPSHMSTGVAEVDAIYARHSRWPVVT
jgi:hypothetical protein